MPNIVENPTAYFRRLVPARGEQLRAMEQEALTEEIPIVGPVVGELLYILARLLNAQRILELGTATGYSSLYLGQACAETRGRVVTLERDPEMAFKARQYIERAGLSATITVETGEAIGLLAQLEGPFDMAFMDIEKVDYIRALAPCHRLLRSGGLLVADNVGFGDADEFNQALRASTDWRSVSIFSFLPLHSPEHDGLCLAVRL